MLPGIKAQLFKLRAQKINAGRRNLDEVQCSGQLFQALGRNLLEGQQVHVFTRPRLHKLGGTGDLHSSQMTETSIAVVYGNAYIFVALQPAELQTALRKHPESPAFIGVFYGGTADKITAAGGQGASIMSTEELFYLGPKSVTIHSDCLLVLFNPIRSSFLIIHKKNLHFVATAGGTNSNEKMVCRFHILLSYSTDWDSLIIYFSKYFFILLIVILIFVINKYKLSIYANNCHIPATIYSILVYYSV